MIKKRVPFKGTTSNAIEPTWLISSKKASLSYTLSHDICTISMQYE
jgi:hypothetical protein